MGLLKKKDKKKVDEKIKKLLTEFEIYDILKQLWK